jgi:hypothetical protein
MPNLKKTSVFVVLILSGFGSSAYGGWKIRAGAQGRWTYDSNVFNLSAGQASDLRAANTADEATGRFLDMNRVGDHVFRPSFSLAADGPGLFGRKLELELTFDYEFLVKNTRRNNAELGASLRQSLWKGGALLVTGRYVPKFFKRNYMVDGEPDDSGVVLPEDREYVPGVYREGEGRLGIEHRLLKRNKKSGSPGLTARIGARLSERRYDLAALRGRDKSGRGLDAGLIMDFKDSWELAFAYRREMSESPIVTEVLLLDEADFAVDFNEDGDLLDLDVRTESTVDRSFNEDDFEATLTAPLGRETDLQLSASRRLRRYVSGEPFDGYQGRRDSRWIFGVEIEHTWGPNLSLIAGYRYSSQTSSFPDVTGDEDDYMKHNVRAGLSFRF